MTRHDPPSPNKPYRRPNRPYVCGRNREGKPCDRGPGPDGKCPHQEDPCVPTWSLRKKRNFVVLTSILITLGFIAFLIFYSRNNAVLLSPGPLSQHHAKFLESGDGSSMAKCSTCHNVADGKDWVLKSIAKHNLVVDSQKCIDCHDAEKNDVAENSMINLKRPHDLGDASSFNDISKASFSKDMHCSQCHREHQGVSGMINVVDNDRCQSCHQQTFESFSQGHPEFKTFPYEKTLGLRFDHASKDHGKLMSDCRQCHSFDESKREFATLSFEQSCQECHSSDVHGGRELLLFSLGEHDTSAPQPIFEYLFGKSNLGELENFMKLRLDTFLLNGHEKRSGGSNWDSEFLSLLLDGLDSKSVRLAMGIDLTDLREFKLIEKALSQSKVSASEFFLKNYWSQLLEEAEGKTLEEKFLSVFAAKSSALSRKVKLVYLKALSSKVEHSLSEASVDEIKAAIKMVCSDETTVVHGLFSGAQPKLSKSMLTEWSEALMEVYEKDTMKDGGMASFLNLIYVDEESLDLGETLLDHLSDEDQEHISEMDDSKKGKLAWLQKRYPNEMSMVWKHVVSGGKTPMEEVSVGKKLPSDTIASLKEEWRELRSEDDVDLNKFLDRIYCEDEELNLEESITMHLSEEDQEVLSEMDSLKGKVDWLYKTFPSSLMEVWNPQGESEGQTKKLEMEKVKFNSYLSSKFKYSEKEGTVSYVSTGHAGALESWLYSNRIKGETKSLNADILAAYHGDKHDCTKCHQDPSVKAVGMNSRWTTMESKSLVKFNHGPHIRQMHLDCSTCHVPATKVGAVSVSGSGFESLSKNVCSACHVEEVAGDSCLKCHNYHSEWMGLERREAHESTSMKDLKTMLQH